MKVKVCLLLASVLASSLLVPVAPASATTGKGTVCKVERGSLTFTPTLPKSLDAYVNSTEHWKGTLSGCNNGVTGGTFTASEKLPNVNCVQAPGDAGKHVTSEKITWKPASMGTSTLQLLQSSSETSGLFAGKVTAGRFKGTQFVSTRVWSNLRPAGACETTGLKSFDFKSSGVVRI